MRPRVRLYYRPQLEPLEGRITPDVMNWRPPPGITYWSDAAN
jgi:hypothetical protein